MSNPDGTIHFETRLFKINDWTLVCLPQDASAMVPSRGISFIEGRLNGIPFNSALEPDGKGSHWFRIEEKLLEKANVVSGDTVSLSIRPSDNRPEPMIPADLKSALDVAPGAYVLWNDITPMARWDWIRWIRSTRKELTRRHRIETAIDKLNKGERRPCCFNRNLCTEPYVSRNGILLRGHE